MRSGRGTTAGCCGETGCCPANIGGAEKVGCMTGMGGILLPIAGCPDNVIAAMYERTAYGRMLHEGIKVQDSTRHGMAAWLPLAVN